MIIEEITNRLKELGELDKQSESEMTRGIGKIASALGENKAPNCLVWPFQHHESWTYPAHCKCYL